MDTKVARIPTALHERAVTLAQELGTSTAEAIERLLQQKESAPRVVEVEALQPRREALDVTPYLHDVGERLERIERQQGELAVGMAGLAAGQLEIVRGSDETAFKQRVFAAMEREAQRRGLGGEMRRVLAAIEALPAGGAS